MKFFAPITQWSRLFAALVLVCLWAGCSTTASAPVYRSTTLRINSVPNAFTAQLASLEAPKLEDELNKAFIADGRFKAGTGLFLSIELTSFQQPRRIGTQLLSDRLGPNPAFLAGTMVVAVRWYDSNQKQLEEAIFAQDILPLPGEISSFAAVNRAITDVSQRIMLYTNSRYLKQ